MFAQHDVDTLTISLSQCAQYLSEKLGVKLDDLKVEVKVHRAPQEVIDAVSAAGQHVVYERTHWVEIEKPHYRLYCFGRPSPDETLAARMEKFEAIENCSSPAFNAVRLATPVGMVPAEWLDLID